MSTCPPKGACISPRGQRVARAGFHPDSPPHLFHWVPAVPLPGWVQTGRSLLLREAAPRGLEHVFPDVQGAQPLLKPELQPVTGQGH